MMMHHACTQCGGSCQGMVVRPIPQLGEPEAIATYADELGIAEPIVDGALRREGGDCVFLDEGHRCRIHTALGAQAKPLVCQTFPVVILRLGEEQRVGIDPACFTDIITWRDGPEVDVTGLLVRRTPSADEAAEAVVIDFLSRPGLTLAEALAPHPGITTRWLTRLREQRPRLDGLASITGSRIRSLWPAFQQTIDTLPADPPLPALGPDEDAYAIDVARRMVALRLAPRLPNVQSVVLLSLLGAVLAGQVSTERETFGACLAAWTRLIRAPLFAQALIPDAATLAWLAVGPRP